MKSFWPRTYRAILLTMLFSLLVVPVTVAAESESESESSPPATELSTGDWIVQLDSGWASFNSFDSISRFMGDSDVETVGSSEGTYVVSFDGETSASDTVARLASNPAVEYVEPDVMYEYQDRYVPDDPGFDNQDWAETVNLPEAWTVSAGDPEMVVALIDSGIRADHPDLQGQIVPGLNYVEGYEDDDTSDIVGHGTAVAGIIAAIGNNGQGIAGTSMNVKLMPFRVGEAEGARVSRIAEAVEVAVDMGAQVINLSLGSETQSARLEQALGYAEANDVIVVAATGNEADKVSFPGSSQSTISVGATSVDGAELADFSSRVSVTDLVAPGEEILTTSYQEDSGNAYAKVKGTSFSTPIVAGTAALIDSVNPELDVHQIRALLRDTAQKSFAEGTVGTGSGLLDANAAIREAMLPSLGATWLTADEPVASQETSRTWQWGPHAFDLRVEPYAEAENGARLVAYFDKARMEISDPYGDRSSEWYVTNGLLVNELITGQMQVGENEFESREPADVPIAGDPDANDGPTYASFANLLDAEGGDEGDKINQTLAPDGTVGDDTDHSEYDVTLEEYIPETGHHIADVFWEYLNSSGVLRQQGQYVEGQIFNPTFFATGFPVTEAYWSEVTVNGEAQDVLIQCFERRCLTYTPGNEDAWQVEMGNVGQHYYRWRYEQEPGGAVAQNPSAYAIANLR